jgi:uncharacterized membrane protein
MLKKEEEMLVAVKERQAKVKKLILTSCILGLLFVVFFLSENVGISVLRHGMLLESLNYLICTIWTGCIVYESSLDWMYC